MAAVIHISVLLILCSLFSAAPALTISLNTTSTVLGWNVVCRDTELWTQPGWTDNIIYHCNRVIDLLEIYEPESTQPGVWLQYEFLPLGMEQQRQLPDVRTPWKLTDGTDHHHLLFLQTLLRVVGS